MRRKKYSISSIVVVQLLFLFIWSIAHTTYAVGTKPTDMEDVINLTICLVYQTEVCRDGVYPCEEGGIKIDEVEALLETSRYQAKLRLPNVENVYLGDDPNVQKVIERLVGEERSFMLMLNHVPPEERRAILLLFEVVSNVQEGLKICLTRLPPTSGAEKSYSREGIITRRWFNHQAAEYFKPGERNKWEIKIGTHHWIIMTRPKR